MRAIAVIPAYTHIDHRLQVALLDAQVPFMPVYGSSDLPKVRSQLLTLGLREATERVLLVDADIVPRPEQLLELAESPLVTPEQALSGRYPIRDARSKREGGRGWADGGLGFCAIHVESLRRLAETLPLIRWPEMDWRPFCVPLVEGDQYYPDDRVLWHRLAQTGTRLAVDDRLRVGHVASVVLHDVV